MGNLKRKNGKPVATRTRLNFQTVVNSPGASAKAELVQRVVDRISAIPGVDSAGFSWSRPMQGIDSDEIAMKVVGRQNPLDYGYFESSASANSATSAYGQANIEISPSK